MIRPVEDVDADVVRQVQQIDRGVAALEHAVYTDNAARNKELRALKDDLRASRRIHADVELLPCQLLLHALGLGVERQIDLCQLRDARKALVMMADDRNIHCAEIARKAAQTQRDCAVAEDEHAASGMDAEAVRDDMIAEVKALISDIDALETELVSRKDRVGAAYTAMDGINQDIKNFDFSLSNEEIDAKLTEIFEGTSEIQKKIIAKWMGVK